MGKISSYIRWMSGQCTVRTYFPRMFTVINRKFGFFLNWEKYCWTCTAEDEIWSTCTDEEELLLWVHWRGGMIVGSALTRRSYFWECTDEEEWLLRVHWWGGHVVESALVRRSDCWECTDEEETIHSVIKKVSWTKVITRSGASKRKEKVNKGQPWGCEKNIEKLW